MPELQDGFYEICGDIDCMHFIQSNDKYDSDSGIFVIAPYIHLDDGEKEHNHDAVPSGVVHTLDEWKALWPELFFMFPDGKIGPNSSQFGV